MYGKFITFEGIDGAGKSQVVDAANEVLEARGISVVITREVGGTPVGESIRNLLLKSNHLIGGDAETLLVFAARAQHVEQLIKPSLAEGKWVLCDRFTDSTYAYQGGGRRIAHDRIELLENWVQKDLRPDLTLVLDTDVEIGKQRLGPQSEHDRFESEYDAADDFFDRVRSTYRRLAELNPQRIRLIDSNRTAEAVRAEVVQVVKDFLGSND